MFMLFSSSHNHNGPFFAPPVPLRLFNPKIPSSTRTLSSTVPAPSGSQPTLTGLGTTSPNRNAFFSLLELTRFGVVVVDSGLAPALDEGRLRLVNGKEFGNGEVDVDEDEEVVRLRDGNKEEEVASGSSIQAKED